VPGQFGTVFCLSTLLVVSITVLQGENKKLTCAWMDALPLIPFLFYPCNIIFFGHAMTTVLWWNKNIQSTINMCINCDKFFVC